ncbi:MAG: ribbon-helix-helix protein, CopG family [Salinibacterium sp.]|nr:ribbon-helix-helix protein, CopG family [Salinibacterium sp.]
MLRTQISLTAAERRALDAESTRTGKSMSALIRDAIAQTYGAERSVEDDLAALDAGFGCWEDRELDGAQWVERLRSGSRMRNLET